MSTASHPAVPHEADTEAVRVDPAARPRFTLDGDEGLELQLALACARAVSGIRGLVPARRLEAVVLGGGYGRGEGGVLQSPTGHRPYNDIEFYVAIRGSRHLNEALYHRRLEVLGEILTQLAGIEVEFKVTSLAEISSRPVSMFSYDLASGHRILWSRDPKAVCAAWRNHLKAEDIPLCEATRLLMNRCSGLLFARARLAETPFTAQAASFVARNTAKVQLACGDALLTARGAYHWSCMERCRRLAAAAREAQSALFDTALRLHKAGVEFKLHPERRKARRDTLASQLAEASDLARDCWLWIESRRLGKAFPTARAYAEHPAVKWPGSPAALNVLLNLRADGPRSRARRALLRHPRERALNALALLLWEPSELVRCARIGVELNAPAAGAAARMEAYRRLWSRVQ
jgi:hypothetical protein